MYGVGAVCARSVSTSEISREQSKIVKKLFSLNDNFSLLSYLIYTFSLFECLQICVLSTTNLALC